MPDLEKVIYSIERCICHVPDACRDCAYDAGHPYNECVELLLRDALGLLKAQEADIKALSEKYADLLDRTLEAVPPEKRELPYGMYDAVKYEYKCGACGCGLMKNEKWRANFCPTCGTAVKWDD